MSLENLDRIQEIFLDAADLPAHEQTAFLDEACKDDWELRMQVEAMLAADRKSGASIAIAVETEAAALFQAQPLEGVRLGAYRIVREIGRGGMGTVYLATRDDAQFDKQVAIKVVKLGMDTADVLDRFRRERQILANLDHPYIARLLDGGTVPDGRPFFVMEYVPGKTIDVYIAENKLSMKDRCRLFLRVCEAVSYAHRNLVVHRDLKPSNILISSDGMPKLLDFGVSKLLTEHVAGEALTVVARPLTPEYASPEQVRGLPVTTASDVYSLGAVFFEILTGKRAQFLTTKTPAEVERVICQVDVEKPSAITPGVDADLDNIVMMAMRKESARRYKSVDELAEDIHRYLDGRPIIARQNSLSYVAKKFVQHYRLQLTAAALVFLSLLVGIVLALTEKQHADEALKIAETQRQVAETERAHAESESQRAETALTAEAREHLLADAQKDRAVAERAVAEKRLTQLIQLADKTLFGVHAAIENLPGAMNARKEIVRTTLEYLEQLSKSGMDDRMRYVLSAAYFKVAEMQGAFGQPNLGDLPGALINYRKAEGILQPLYQRNQSDGKVLSQWIFIEQGLATALYGLGEREKALTSLRLLLKDARRIALLEPTHLEALLHAPDIHSILYTILQSQDARAALEAASEHVRLAEQLLRTHPTAINVLQQLAVAYLQVAVLQMDLNVAEGTRYFELSLRMRESLREHDPKNVAILRGLSIAYGNYASVLGSPLTNNLGQFDKSKMYFEKSVAIARELVKADPQNSTAQFDLAVSMMRLGSVEGPPAEDQKSVTRLEESIQLLNALPASIQKSPKVILERSFAQEYVGRLLTRMRQFDRAEASLRQSLGPADGLLARDPRQQSGIVQAMVTEQALAEMFLASGNREQAIAFARQAIQRALKYLAMDPSRDRVKSHVAKCLLVLSKVQHGFSLEADARQSAGSALQQWKQVSDTRELQSVRKLISDAEKLAKGQ